MEFYIQRGKINNIDALFKTFERIIGDFVFGYPIIPEGDFRMEIKGHSKVVNYTKRNFLDSYEKYFDLNLRVLFLNAYENNRLLYISGISDEEIPYFVILNKKGLFLRTLDYITRRRYYRITEGLLKLVFNR